MYESDIFPLNFNAGKYILPSFNVYEASIESICTLEEGNSRLKVFNAKCVLFAATLKDNFFSFMPECSSNDSFFTLIFIESLLNLSRIIPLQYRNSIR